MMIGLYSDRSAIAGSTRVARWAGRYAVRGTQDVRHLGTAAYTANGHTRLGDWGRSAHSRKFRADPVKVESMSEIPSRVPLDGKKRLRSKFRCCHLDVPERRDT